MRLEQFSPLKVLNHAETIQGIVEGNITYPISCEIDVSNYCNHSCIWCINGKFRKREKVSWEKDKLLEVITQLAEAGVKSITFTGGGEPLTHPDISLFLRFVREKGMETAIVTNGGLLDEEKAQAILETCEFIRFSLDAGEEKTYSRVHRARNTIKDILSWINYLYKKTSANFVIGVAFLVHPYNYREIYTASYLVKQVGASYIQIRPVFMRGMDLTGRILHETNRQIYKSLDLQDELFKVYPILHRFIELNTLNRNYDECLGHNLLGVIAANGKMYLCCQLRGSEKYCLGDLYRQTFKQIWEGQQRKEAIKNINIQRCPPCRYTRFNEILEYLKGERTHANFL